MGYQRRVHGVQFFWTYQLTMKLFICLFALFACAAAAPQYFGYGGYGGYSHGLPADLAPAVLQNGLVSYPNGAVVPSLTPSVAAATHAHLATKFGAYGGYLG